MDWRPTGLILTGKRETVKATASELEQPKDCECRAGLKLRSDTWVDTGRWRSRGPGPAPLNWFVFIDGLEPLHRALEASGSHDAALKAARLAWSTAHPGLRTFLDHAIEEYLELHESRQQQRGPMKYLKFHAEISMSPANNVLLYAWAPVYETPDGGREIRRLRMSNPKSEVTSWAAAAAKVALHLSATIAPHATVIEVALANGAETTVLDRIGPKEVEDLYLKLVQPRAREIWAGQNKTACARCVSCKALAVCSEPIPMGGVLRQSQRGVGVRSVSAADLTEYALCPARWYLDRFCHLPKDDGDDADPAPMNRGLSVHRWLERAHERGQSCHPADVPDPDDFAEDSIGWQSLSPDDYRVAWPFIKQHVAHCVAGDDTLLGVEETLYGWDAQADVLVAGKPDLLRRDGDTLVIREVKTSDKELPASALIVRDQYDGVVYWWLSMLNGGWSQYFGCSNGRVEMELLTPNDSAVYVFEADNEDLVEIAESRMESWVNEWHRDGVWATRPSPSCSRCPVRRWCPDSEAYLDLVAGADAEPPF